MQKMMNFLEKIIPQQQPTTVIDPISNHPTSLIVFGLAHFIPIQLLTDVCHYIAHYKHNELYDSDYYTPTSQVRTVCKIQSLLRGCLFLIVLLMFQWQALATPLMTISTKILQITCMPPRLQIFHQ